MHSWRWALLQHQYSRLKRGRLEFAFCFGIAHLQDLLHNPVLTSNITSFFLSGSGFQTTTASSAPASRAPTTSPPGRSWKTKTSTSGAGNAEIRVWGRPRRTRFGANSAARLRPIRKKFYRKFATFAASLKYLNSCTTATSRNRIFGNCFRWLKIFAQNFPNFWSRRPSRSRTPSSGSRR